MIVVWYSWILLF